MCLFHWLFLLFKMCIRDRGGGLSIGQKQLLAFARTMVSDPAILILDEATSSIDTNTELLVQELSLIHI